MMYDVCHQPSAMSSADKKSPAEAKQPKAGDTLKAFKKNKRKKRPSMFLSTRDQYIFNFNIGMVYDV